MCTVSEVNISSGILRRTANKKKDIRHIAFLDRIKVLGDILLQTWNFHVNITMRTTK